LLAVGILDAFKIKSKISFSTNSFSATEYLSANLKVKSKLDWIFSWSVSVILQSVYWSIASFSFLIVTSSATIGCQGQVPTLEVVQFQASAIDFATKVKLGNVCTFTASQALFSSHS
jgi:hypothetical protein